MRLSKFHGIDYKSDIFIYVTPFGSDASSLFAIALVVFLQSALRSIIGRQFDKSNKTPSFFGIGVITPLL